MSIENPGSFNEFVAKNPGAQPEQYFRLLEKYRGHLAELVGVEPPKLHDMGPTRVKPLIERNNNVEGETA